MIEFMVRIWDKKSKQMIAASPLQLFNAISCMHSKKDLYFGTWVIGNITEEFNTGIDSLNKFQERFEIMRRSGLVDKNGHYIYEGDILKHDPDFYHKQPWYRQVEYSEGIDSEGHISEGFLIDSYSQKGSIMDFEIIGNIYENPELLEECKKL